MDVKQLGDLSFSAYQAFQDYLTSEIAELENDVREQVALILRFIKTVDDFEEKLARPSITNEEIETCFLEMVRLSKQMNHKQKALFGNSSFTPETLRKRSGSQSQIDEMNRLGMSVRVICWQDHEYLTNNRHRGRVADHSYERKY